MTVRGVLSLVLLAAAGATLSQEELALRDSPQGKVFGCPRFAVRLDPQTGWAGEVLCDGVAVLKAPDTPQVLDIKQDEAWVTGGGAKVVGLGVERVAPDTVRSRMRAGSWSIDAYVQLVPEARMLRRWFEVAWQGQGEAKLKAFWIQGGLLPLGEGGGYFVPAQYPPRRVGAKELAAGHKANSGRSPYPVIGETGGGWSAVWVQDELVAYADRGGAGVLEGAGAIRVTQSFSALGRMRTGAVQKIGDAWLWLQPNDAETALRRMGEWFRLVKQVPPADRPEWLKRVILYSFHPGGTIGSQCKDLGGFKAAEELLPHIKGLGCNALWLMPLEDKSIYWPRDYYKLQEGLGSPEDFKSLSARAHGLGMRVWQDCVPHGGCNEFPRAKEHPEWLAQNEDGSTLHYWCFDFNWPTWIDYMSGVVSFYTREYGLDGFRIDACGGSKIPNWNPAIPYGRASYAQSQGGLAMQRALRQAVKVIRPDGANLAEVGASIHGAVSDSTYDFDLCYHVLHDFRKLPAEEFAPKLRRWLHEQSCAEVPDLVRMRHVESHDSLRSGLWYGADAQRALVALISWIHGIPMVYHEMEDGHYEAYRRIFHVRSQVPELSDGAADYLSVGAPEGVFACLRTNAANASVVLVNLSGKAVRGAVVAPAAALRGASWARDLMTGEKVAVRDGRMEVSLAPFGYTVLRPAGARLAALQALKTAAPAKPAVKMKGPARVEARSGALLIDAGTGLAQAWKTGWATIPLRLDLALPERLADTNRMTTVNSYQPGSRYSRMASLAEGGLTVAYESGEGGVGVRASWLSNKPVAPGQRPGEFCVSDGVLGRAPAGAALLVDLPTAERWFAATAEGYFESPFRVRHPGCDGVVGSIYRLPQGTAVLWDSRLHPFGLDAAHAKVGAEAGGRRLSLSFDPARLPASVQLLDRIGDDHGLRVLITWREASAGVTSGVDEVACTFRTEEPADGVEAGTGDPRLTAAGGGWVFENSHYRARVGRSGALAGLWRRDGAAWRLVVNRSKLYADRGFDGDKELSQEDDVEATARIERAGGGVRLSFAGELRGFYRFDKMARPVRFYTSYVFGDGPAFRRTCAYNAEARAAGDYAFLSLQTSVDGAERVSFVDAGGEFLTGARGGGRGRYAQTAKAPGARRLPQVARVLGAGGTLLRLSDVAWFGAAPANVFMDGGDLHLAWEDGRPTNGGAGRWSGVSMSVSCAEGADAPADAAALPASGVAALLRDGAFSEGAGEGVALVTSGRRLPDAAGVASAAWQLPAGAEYVSESDDRCVSVTGDGKEYRMVRQALPAQAFPAGSKWRLTARVRAQGVRPADQGWKTACVRWGLFAGERFRYEAASLPAGDSGWRDVSVEMTAPAGLTALTAEAGMNGNAGRIWIDDVRIEELKAAN